MHVLSAGESLHYFACVLRHIVSLGTLGATPDRHAADLHRRHMDLVRCLASGEGERATYELRLISRPDAGAPSQGQIVVALIGRLEGVTAEDAQRRAQEVLRLMAALFDDYGFDLGTPEDVEALLRPFPVNHLVGIRRRSWVDRLDTLQDQHRRSLGFLRTDGHPDDPGGRAAVLHIAPYRPSGAPMNRLFNLLLLQPHPVAIGVRLRSTTLTAAEQVLLEDQIARCEWCAQAALHDLPDDLSSLRPALREQATLHQQHQARMLFGLRDRALLMTVEVASPEPVAATVAGALGSLITEPAGGAAGGFEDARSRYLAGGFEVVDLRKEDASAVAAFEEMEMLLAPNPAAPPDGARLLHLFDPVDAVAAFRLPPATLEPIPGLVMRHWRTQPPPRDLPADGLTLGISGHEPSMQPVRIGPHDLSRHIYVVGQTGTGKTTLLTSMILDDMRRGEGLCVIDPHGDLFRDLLGRIPEARADDVILLDPTDVAHPVGLNLLEHQTETQRHFLVQELVGILSVLIQDGYGAAALGEMAGPIFFQHMRMNLLLAMSDPDRPGTLLHFYMIYQERDYWRRWLPLRTGDPLLERWTKHVLAKTDYLRPGSEGASMGSWVASKFEGFVFDPLLRNIFGQARSTIDVRTVMDKGKILLVNLAKGELTQENSRFLGMVLLAKLMAAALGRVELPERARRGFRLYVDEFQSLATRSFVTLLSEARKFGVSLVLANQFVTQLRDSRIGEAIFGNVGTLVCFRLGHADAELMDARFSPAFNRADLTNLPNRQACVATLVEGQAAQPFSLRTLRDWPAFDPHVATRVRARSRERHGRPRAEAEAEIARSLDVTSDGNTEEKGS